MSQSYDNLLRELSACGTRCASVRARLFKLFAEIERIHTKPGQWRKRERVCAKLARARQVTREL